jgi:hypothetical protein
MAVAMFVRHRRERGASLKSTFRRPSPAMVVALIALFVSLSGTAMAAKPVARALFANNAGKLQGSTRAQVIAAAAAAVKPPTVTSVRGLVSVSSKEFFVLGGEAATETVSCTSGRVISGFWTTTLGGRATAGNITPTSETTWSFEMVNLRADGPARGTLSVVCLA